MGAKEITTESIAAFIQSKEEGKETRRATANFVLALRSNAINTNPSSAAIIVGTTITACSCRQQQAVGCHSQCLSSPWIVALLTRTACLHAFLPGFSTVAPVASCTEMLLVS